MKKLLATILLTIAVAGCNSWERNTFNTLAATKAVLDTAQNDYENKTIPQTQCAYALINDAKAADTYAVNAMIAYEQLKAQKGNLQAQEAAVISDLAALAPMIVQVQSLISNPAGACGGKQ
jgi:hypothetical protein